MRDQQPRFKLSLLVRPVFHLDPQRPGGNSNVQGGRNMGAMKGWVLGRGCLGAVPPEKFLKFGNKY